MGGPLAHEGRRSRGHQAHPSSRRTQERPQTSCPAYRSWGRIHVSAVHEVLRRARRWAPADGAVYATSKWRRRATESNRRGHGQDDAQGKGSPWYVLGEAVNAAVYILNRTTTKGTGGKTSYELWNGAAPSVHHLRTFGCVAHVKIVGTHLKKLDDRSKPMVFVGYEPGSKAYHVYDPTSRRVHASRDVIFDEDAWWDWSKDSVAAFIDDFEVESMYPESPGEMTMLQPLHEQEAAGPSAPATVSAASPTTPILFASPPSRALECVDADHGNSAPLRFRTIENIVRSAPMPSMAWRELDEDLLLASEVEPTTFEQAQKEESWRVAMLDEMMSIEANST